MNRLNAGKRAQVYSPANGFSKKIENHGHAIALHFMHYNFAGFKTLRVAPVKVAGSANHVWAVEGLVGLIRGAGLEAA